MTALLRALHSWIDIGFWFFRFVLRCLACLPPMSFPFLQHSLPPSSHSFTISRFSPPGTSPSPSELLCLTATPYDTLIWPRRRCIRRPSVFFSPAPYPITSLFRDWA